MVNSSVDYRGDGKLLAAVQVAFNRFVILVDREDSVPGFRFVVATYRSGDSSWYSSDYRGCVKTAREAFRKKAVDCFSETITDALFPVTSHAVANGFIPDFSDRRS